MYIGLIARRYATALADFAEKMGQEDVVYTEVQQLLGFYASVPELKRAIESPVAANDAKLGVLLKLMGDTSSGTLRSFLKLVFAHEREKWLQFILHSYIALYKKRHGIVEVKLTTASPLDTKMQERLCELVKERSGSKVVEMQVEVDDSIIGGFLLRKDNLLVDDTIATQLARIKKEMTSKNNRIV